MRHIALICAAALMAVLPVCGAQTAHHNSKPDPKPAPTEQDLAEFIRGQLMAFSPDDGINDNVEVTYNPDIHVLTVVEPTGRCNTFFNALDANTLVWDVFDASDSMNSREKLLRLTVISAGSKTARMCYDKENRVDTSFPTTHTRFLFALYKTDEAPDFQLKFGKAIKSLIALVGGVPEQKLF